MAILDNGLETAPLAATGWRIIYNNNFLMLYTKNEINALLGEVKDIPANIKNSTYTLTANDRGKSIDTTANVIVPLASSAPFPIGSVVTVTNTSATSFTISPASGVTLRFAGTSDVGNCVLNQYGIATLRKVEANTWFIVGAGLAFGGA